MSLKDLTKEQHTNAERQKFVPILMSGEIEVNVYFHYLVNQHACYSALENCQFNLPDDRLKRASAIGKDTEELKLMGPIPNTCYNLEPSTKKYVKYVKNKIKDEDQFLAHVYVRYLGDLRGGQMIAKKVPGRGHYYQFEEPKELAESIYSKLHDGMVDEARLVFDFATDLFKELYERHFSNPKRVRRKST
tara:strand:+ start:132 stop:701 length:570 start_codon:yes stop_codon:yes gene_type:complete